MSRLCLVFTFFFLHSGLTLAGDPSSFPKGLPPVVGTAVSRSANVGVELTITCPVPRWKNVPGKWDPELPKLSTLNHIRPSNTKESIRIRLVGPMYTQRTETRVFDLNGKQLSHDEVVKRLEKESPVLVAVDGGTVDPYYLQIVKPDTLIISLSGWDGAPATRLYPMPDESPELNPK